MPETTASPQEIKKVADRALVLQRYLLRRAWGIGYAAWSVAMFWEIFGSPISASLGLSPYGRIVIGMIVSGGALTIILRAFKRVRDTSEIRSLVLEGRWKSVIAYRVVMPLWAANFAIIFTLISVFGLKDPGLLGAYVLAVYVVWLAFLSYAMRLSFPGRLPGEAIAALGSFGIALAYTIVLVTFKLAEPGIGLLWGSAVVVWVASGLYARRRPVPEWEAHLSE